VPRKKEEGKKDMNSIRPVGECHELGHDAPNLYVNSLKPNVTISGNRPTVGIIKVKCGHNGGTLLQ
jgi:hypothetical protein